MTDQPSGPPRPLRIHPPRHPLATFVGGFLMGSADVVPGVSGGTIALVLGIYEQLVHEIRTGAGALGSLLARDLRGFSERFRAVRWGFLLPLLAGILTAVLVLARVLEHLLEEQPVALSALFLGLVAGSVVIAVGELKRPAVEHAVIGVAVAVGTFFALGLRSGTVADPTLVVVFLAGAVAVCAMILPGVSGSFLLLLMGMYDPVIAAASDRDVVTAGVFAVGAVVGLAAFSTLLDWSLRRYHDRVLAALIGLMAGSLRVLWPWPAGSDGVADTRLGTPVTEDLPVAVGLALAGLAAVGAVAWLGRLVRPRPAPEVGDAV